MSRAVPWFPAAGALIGAAVGGVAAGMWQLVPPLLAAAVAVTAGLLITGAFHEDGLADIADAFGGGWTVDRRLEILKDPRHGSYGVAAMCSSVVVRIVALGSLGSPAAMFAAAVAAHTVGRVSAVGLMISRPALDRPGLGSDYTRSLHLPACIAGMTAGIGLAAVAVGWWAAPLAGAALLAAAAVGWLAHRKIGGISGDVLGACEQVAECLCLVVLAGALTRHRLWWR